MLRTSFHEGPDGGGEQHVHADAAVALSIHAYTGDTDDTDDALRAFIAQHRDALRAEPFDLARPPLFRARLLELGPRRVPVDVVPSHRRRWLVVPADRAGSRVAVRRAAQVDALARRLRTTPYVVFLSAFLLMLSRRTGQRDLVVGSPVANRASSRTEARRLFVNLLALRVAFPAASSTRAWIERVRDCVMAAHIRTIRSKSWSSVSPARVTRR